jgi:hypothetical protein
LAAGQRALKHEPGICTRKRRSGSNLSRIRAVG